MTTLDVALVGLGEIAERRYAPELRRQPGVRLAAVCSRTEASCRTFARNSGARRWTTDPDTILNDPSIAAVIIATPHPAHAALAVAALRAQKHVLIEKPVATSFEDARAVLAASEASGAIAMALPFDAQPWLSTVARLLRARAIGSVVSLAVDQGGPGPSPTRGWKYRRDQAGGGALLAHGVYGLSALVSLLGPAQAVAADLCTVQRERLLPGGGGVHADVEDLCRVSLRYSTRQLVQLSTAWTHARTHDTLTLRGSHGTIIACHGEVWLSDGAASTRSLRPRSLLRRVAERVGVCPGSGLRRVHRAQATAGIVDEFVTAIHSGRPPGSSLRQAVHVIEIVTRAYQSSAGDGGFVPLVSTFEPRAHLPPELFDLSSPSVIRPEVSRAVR